MGTCWSDSKLTEERFEVEKHVSFFICVVIMDEYSLSTQLIQCFHRKRKDQTLRNIFSKGRREILERV